MNVLLTSVGRRVALVRAFQRETAALYPSARVYGADASSRSAGFHTAHGVLVPRCLEPGYIDALLDIVTKHDIKAIVPLIDTELLVLAQNRDRFAAKGCNVVVSDATQIEITRHKGTTAERFAALGFRTPRTIANETVDHALANASANTLSFPLFLKPAAGSSSIGAVRIDDIDTLRFHYARTKDPVVQHLEKGDEYTIDVFANAQGRAVCAVPRRRWETRAGEISKGVTVKSAKLTNAAMKLVDKLGGCRGCVTLQCFDTSPGENDVEPVFFEANLRFGGGFPLSDAAGANYVRWTLEMVEGKDIPRFDGWRDGVAMMRYDDAVFVDAKGLV